MGKTALITLRNLLVFFTLVMLLGLPEGAVAASDTGPDLTIGEITLTPVNPTVRDRVTFTVTVRNIGNERSDSAKVDCYIGSERIGSAYTDPLVPGASQEMLVTWKPQPGNHTVRAAADTGQAITERDETNNDLTLAFSVLAPNLVVSEITWLPEKPSARDKVVITVVTTNQGNTAAGNSNLEFFIDGASRGYLEIPRLEPGCRTATTYNWVARPGAHEIRAANDVLSQVAESDETDNVKTAICQPLAPDLVISAIGWSPPCPFDGDNVTFTFTVKNLGEGKAVASHLACQVDGSYLTSAAVPELNPDAVFKHTFSWIAGAGLHTAIGIADSAGENEETDETNNERIESLSEAVPDLVVQSITWSPSRPTTGQSVTANVTLQNRGHGACGVSTLDFMVGTLRYSALVEAIRGDSTAWTVFTWTAQEGAQTLTAIADSENYIEEEFETNNTRTVSMTPSKQLPPPDLAVKNLAWSPANPAVGDTVILTAAIKNEGSSQAASFTFLVYLDGECIESAIIGNLDAGASTSLDFSWQASPGVHLVTAIADSGGSIIETNEDNTYVTHLPVLAPDLVVTDLSYTPADAATGDTMTLTAVVENRGNYPSAASYLGYFVSGSPRGNLYLEEMPPGGITTKSITLTMPAKPFTLKAIADFKSEVTELDENNNEKAVAATLVEPAAITETIKENDDTKEDVIVAVPPVASPPAPTFPAVTEAPPAPQSAQTQEQKPAIQPVAPAPVKTALAEPEAAAKPAVTPLASLLSSRWLPPGLFAGAVIPAVSAWLLYRRRKSKSHPATAKPQGVAG